MLGKNGCGLHSFLGSATTNHSHKSHKEQTGKKVDIYELGTQGTPRIQFRGIKKKLGICFYV